jgi:hypothetical protein
MLMWSFLCEHPQQGTCEGYLRDAWRCPTGVSLACVVSSLTPCGDPQTAS